MVKLSILSMYYTNANTNALTRPNEPLFINLPILYFASSFQWPLQLNCLTSSTLYSATRTLFIFFNFIISIWNEISQVYFQMCQWTCLLIDLILPIYFFRFSNFHLVHFNLILSLLFPSSQFLMTHLTA